MATNNAYLNNLNTPLGTEFDDGVRVGPVLTRTVTTGAGANTSVKPYGYQQWGQGLLSTSIGTYNIIPRPTSLGNIVGYGAAATPTGAGYLNLSADGLVTTSEIAGNGNVFLQLDWPRVLSVAVLGGDINANVTVTIFGFDYYGVALQESVAINDEGLYVMKKAFYGVTQVYWNGVQVPGGVSIQIQATNAFGLPYRIKSAGDIQSIRWGGASDLSTNEESPTTDSYMGVATLNGTTGVTVETGAITKGSNVQVTRVTPAGTLGHISVPLANIVSNTSFLIDNDEAETSTVNWLITNPPYTSGSTNQLTGAGVRTMEAGVITIPSTNVNADSKIYATVLTLGGTHGAWQISRIDPQVSFRITSESNTETSTLNWVIAPEEWTSGISDNLVATAGGSLVTVKTTAVQSTSIIMVNYKTISGTAGTLQVPSADIIDGVSFVIRSSSATDTSTVQWTIAETAAKGIGTLVAGEATITIPESHRYGAFGVFANYNTFAGTTGTFIDILTIDDANGVFTVAAKNNAGTTITTDISTFNWVAFQRPSLPRDYIVPLGTFIPADDNEATNTSGDVRGTYLPSTPADGENVLHFTAFYSGFDNFVNQQASNQLSAGGTSNQDLRTRRSTTIDDQVGVMQYYTGTPAS